MGVISLISSNTIAHVDEEDPYFQEFFDSLKSATGELTSLPEEIELPDYVLNQWSHWLVLKEWLKRGSFIFDNWMYPVDDRKLLTAMEAMEIQPIEGESDQDLAESVREEWNLSAVALADVEVFVGMLINLPEDWEMYVYVDERTPLNRRKAHYKKAGEFALYRRIPSPVTLWGDFSDGNWPIADIYKINLLAGMRNDAILRQIGDGREVFRYQDVKTNGKNEKYFGTKIVSVAGEHDWSYVIWKDVISLDLVGNNERLVDYLAGTSLTVEQMKKDDAVTLRNGGNVGVHYNRGIPSEYCCYNAPLMHKKMIEVYSDIEDPILLGLSPLMSGKKLHSIVSELNEKMRLKLASDGIIGVPICYLLRVIHLSVLYIEEEELHTEHLPYVISRIMKKLGDEALLFITNKMIPYAEKTGDELSSRFCSLALTYLEKSMK
jgi:hypothetical protein